MGNSYQFRLKGHLDEIWADWLSVMGIGHQRDGTTLTTGTVTNPFDLHGLPGRFRDLNIPLLSSVPFLWLNRLSRGQSGINWLPSSKIGVT
jgi:hypothetical protein